MSDAQLSDAAARRAQQRKIHACNECKRRKVRCSGDDKCANCIRDGKQCQYSSPLGKVAALERRLAIAEHRTRLVERAWERHLPHLDLNEAVQSLSIDNGVSDVIPSMHSPRPNLPDSLRNQLYADEAPETSPAELSNAEQFEFDETKEFNDNTDGMGSLVVEPSKAGYTGPQSGIAALKFLHTLPLCIPSDNANPLSVEAVGGSATPPGNSAHVGFYINKYFEIYHPAYPLLHEGSFRARVAGALAKPRDGSWPILYNMVLAMGAFVDDNVGGKNDIPFYKVAREHLTMDVLEKGSLSYVQGLTIMANYLQKRNKPNSGFVLIGIAWSMAMGIGLHREFGPSSTTPFTMEIRRRVWWNLFIFVSGSQLTLGRPAASLIGINVRLPSNLDDTDLAVDLEELPTSREGPTISTCLIHQIGLAKIANNVQVELLTHEIPRDERAKSLDQNILAWRRDLPACFDDYDSDALGAEFARRALLWRSFHLRIVLNRPLIFKAISARARLDSTQYSVHACLTSAAECVDSICGFFEADIAPIRGLAWYATYWLITASFVQATCYVYNSQHDDAPAWRLQLDRAVRCLAKLGSAHSMALRARDILQQLLDHSEALSAFQSPSSNAPARISDDTLDWWQVGFPDAISSQLPPSTHSAANLSEGGLTFPWYGQGSTDVEWLDAAGGIVLQGASQSVTMSNSGIDARHSLWMTT